MPLFRFEVRGNPRGYTTHNRGNKNKSPAILAYWKYCDGVRMCARGAGIRKPLEATKTTPLMIFTRCYFVNGTHADPENVHKGIKDALFYKSPNGDKYTGGHYLPPMYDQRKPRVEVFIRPLIPEDESIWES